MESKISINLKEKDSLRNSKVKATTKPAT